MPRIMVIGDIHGCVDEHRKLIDLLAPAPSDTLVYVGDFLDKGPDGPQVVKDVRERARTVPTVVVLGNHEDSNLRFCAHELARRSTGKTNPVKDPDGERSRNFEAMSDADIGFLKGAVLYHQFVAGGQPFLVVHGGIAPGQDLPDLVALPTLSRDEREKASTLTRLRHVRGRDYVRLTVKYPRVVDGGGVEEMSDEIMMVSGAKALHHIPDGALVKAKIVYKDDMIPLGEEQPEDPFWAEVYDGRYGVTFFGHSAFLGEAPQAFPYAYGIDMGCVYGGHLCAAVIDTTTGETTFAKVPAQRVYDHHYKPTRLLGSS